MAKKPALTPDQAVAWSLMRKEMDESGTSRDKLSLATLRKLTKAFNASTGKSLSAEEYRDVAVGVDKKGVAKVLKALEALGLSRPPKS